MGRLLPCYARCGGGTSGARTTSTGRVNADATAVGAGGAPSGASVSGGTGATHVAHPHAVSWCGWTTAGGSSDPSAVSAAFALLGRVSAPVSPADCAAAAPAAQSDIVLVSAANNCPSSGSKPQHPNDHTVASAVTARATRIRNDGVYVMMLTQHYAVEPTAATPAWPEWPTPRQARKPPSARPDPRQARTSRKPAALRYRWQS